MSRSPKRSVILPPDARRTASGAAVSQAQVPMCIKATSGGFVVFEEDGEGEIPVETRRILLPAPPVIMCSSAFGKASSSFMHSVIFSTAVRNAFDLLSPVARMYELVDVVVSEETRCLFCFCWSWCCCSVVAVVALPNNSSLHVSKTFITFLPSSFS